jgi:hypothetical protein
MEWIVAAVLLLAGMVAAVGFYWGNRDPLTRQYKPGIGSFFVVGRNSIRPRHIEEPDKDANDSGPRANPS